MLRQLETCNTSLPSKRSVSEGGRSMYRGHGSLISCLTFPPFLCPPSRIVDTYLSRASFTTDLYLTGVVVFAKSN